MVVSSWCLLVLLRLAIVASEDSPACGNVFLTVSSLRRTADGRKEGFVERELELNWDAECEFDWIGLFTEYPGENGQAAHPLVRVDPRMYPDGYYLTNFTFRRQYPGLWSRVTEENSREGERFISYWIASFRDNILLKANTLQVHPTWMGDHRQQLKQLNLHSMFIPGTHNSGCYQKASPSARRDAFARYLITQDTDVWGQLVHGIRYLDLRIGYYPAKGKVSSSNKDHVSRFWVNHDLVHVGPLLPIFQDIKEFLKNAPHEIVILDLHRFPVGFRGRASRHKRLVALIEQELGEFILPCANITANSTLSDVWNTKCRLIVAYGDNKTASEIKWLWRPISQMWGNQQTIDGLKQFLQQCMDSMKLNHNRSGLWAAMAELTPTPLDIMFGPAGGLREMADMVNRNITRWFQNNWWDRSNIVATDFFLGNNIIEVAINANLRRAMKTESINFFDS